MILRVRSLTRATPVSRIVRLDLGGRRFPYRAGQAVLLGIAGQDQRGPYSIASAPEEARAGGYLEFLIKTGPDGRFAAHLAGLRRGARVEVDGPVGTFVLPGRPAERHLVFIAGGAGIAPLRAMLQHALAQRIRRRVTVVYSARSPRYFAYAAELRRLARERRIDLVLLATRKAGPGWRGGRSRLDAPLLRSLVQSPLTLCFLCGPPGLVAGAASRLQRLGVAERRIRMDNWEA